MRSRIQQLGLEIYNLDLTLNDTEREKLWPVQGYLIGIVFSLWRAVFLSLPERAPTAMHKHGREILKTVLETNTVGFAQDRATRQWMAGYYNNNAILRLSDLFRDPDAISVIKHVMPHNMEETAIGWYTPERQTEFTNLTPKKQCELAFEALEMTFRLLQRAHPDVTDRLLPR